MRSPLKAVSFLAFALLVALSSRAQQSSRATPQALPLPDNPRFVFEHIGDRLGLNTKTVTGFLQDRDGFVWVGTQTGLLRLDGSSFTSYGRSDGLPTEVIDQLALGPDGTVWMGSEVGIAHFNGTTFVPLQLPSELKINSVYQPFAIDLSGAIWVATTTGLLRVDPSDSSKHLVWTIRNGLPANAIDGVFAEPGGAILFVCGNHVVRLASPQAKPEILAPQITTGPEGIVALLEDNHKVIWVRTSNHVTRLDPGSAKFVADDAHIPKANDFGMPSLTRAGELMVPSVAGLFLHLNGRWQRVGEKQGMTSDAVFAALEDSEGATWIGYGGRGFERWPGRGGWLGWTKDEGLPDNVIWCELRDSLNRLWVGTNNGLAMWDAAAHRWRIWTEEQGIAGDTIRQMALGKDGAIWVLSFPGGLTRFDPQGTTPTKVPLPPNTRVPSGLTVAPDGKIWVGNFQYLKILDFSGGAPHFRDVSLPAEVVGSTSHPQFRGSVLWTSGRNAVSRFDGQQWTHFNTAQGLRSNVVSEVLPVSDQEIWFRYEESYGLGHLKLVNGKVEISHLETASGLSANNVSMLGMDTGHNVWAGADHGVSVVASDGKIKTFTQTDGLLWNDMSAGGFYAESDGSVLLGTSRGLAAYDPRHDVHVFTPIKVLITSVLLGNRERQGEKNPRAELAESAFTARFAALTFAPPEDVSCRYRLRNTPYTVTRLREVRYSELLPGAYRFEVSCRKMDSEWSPPAIFAFSIQSPWYERAWARALQGLVVVLIIWAMVRLRTRALESDRRRLEAAVAARSAELAAANRELEQAALTDHLTGVRNRRFFTTTIGADASQAIRAYSDAAHSTDHRDLIFYLVDVDHFKQINDQHGHRAGDLALTQVSERLNRVVRSSDMLIRWGGEEFLVVSRSSERKDAQILAGRILQAVGSQPLQLDEGNAIVRTCSLGWAAFPWNRSAPSSLAVEEVLALVDRALYIAKNSGRNMAIGLIPREDLTDAQFEDSSLETQELSGHTVQLLRLRGPSTAAVEMATKTQRKD